MQANSGLPVDNEFLNWISCIKWSAGNIDDLVYYRITEPAATPRRNLLSQCPALTVRLKIDCLGYVINIKHSDGYNAPVIMEHSCYIIMCSLFDGNFAVCVTCS